MYRYRPNDLLGLLELRPHVSYRGYWKPDGFQESGRLHVDNHLEWRSGWELHTGVNLTHEGVIEPFEIYPGVIVPPGSYDNAEAQLVGITNQGAPLSLDTRVTAGGFFGGSRVSLEAALRGRIGDSLQRLRGLLAQRRDLSTGDFVTNLLRLRFSYSFTTAPLRPGAPPVQRRHRQLVHEPPLRLAAGRQQRLVRRLQREPRPPTLDEGGVGLRDRSFIIKYSHTFDLLD